MKLNSIQGVLGLLFFSMIQFSCSSDTEDFDSINNNTHNTTLSTSVKYKTASSARSEKDVVIPTGYDDIITISDLKKFAVNNAMARQMNIVPGIYFAKIILVRKNLQAEAGYNIFYPEATTSIENLKYKTGSLDANIIYSTRKFGWAPDSQKADANGNFVGKTYLLYLYANSAGQQVAYYYPYAPKKLQWRFVAKKVENIEF